MNKLGSHQMKETFDVVRLICYNTYVNVTLRYVKRFSSSSARTSGDSTKTGQAQLMERPQPKNTAKFVLPPRNPNIAAAEETTTRIDVTETSIVREQTIEEVVKEI